MKVITLFIWTSEKTNKGIDFNSSLGMGCIGIGIH